MLRPLDNATIAALQRAYKRWIIAVAIDLPGLSLRLSSGQSNFEFNGETYTYGSLSSLGAIGEEARSKGLSLEVGVVAVDPAVMTAFANADYINSPARVYLLPHDEDWNIIGGGILFFDGVLVDSSLSYGRKPEVRLRCGSSADSAFRVRSERYSDAEQQAKYPGDLGMQYAAEVGFAQVIWPAASFYED